MNEHTDSDLQAEIAALRQRLSDLEAEHRELKRQAARTRRPAFLRKFLFSALPVALLLAGVGVLYAVDALFVDKSGNVGIGNNSPTQKLDVTGNAKISGKLDVGGDVTVAGSLSLANKMFALSGQEQLRILRGNVSASRKVEAGAGFKVEDRGTGKFFIWFDKAFEGTPSAWILPVKIYTGDKASIDHLDNDYIEVAIVDEHGMPADRRLTFVILGPEKQTLTK